MISLRTNHALADSTPSTYINRKLCELDHNSFKIFREFQSTDQAMYSLKRKADSDEGSKQGAFPAEALPPKTFSLGDNLFVCCNYFNNNVLIHIRRYKKLGEKFYPTSEGVTMSPFQFSTLLSCEPLKTKCFKENTLLDYFTEFPFKASSKDPVSIVSESQLTIQDEHSLFDGNEVLFELKDSSITLKKDAIHRNGKTTTKEVTVSSEQWDKLLSVGDSIMTCAIREKYHRPSFLEFFELVTKTSTPHMAHADEVVDVEDTLNYLLKSAFYDVIAERSGLTNPRATLDDSLLEKNTVRAFNAHVLNVGLFYIVEEFYKNLCEFRLPNHSCYYLSSCLTKQFLNSINVSNMIDMAREAFCKFSK